MYTPGTSPPGSASYPTTFAHPATTAECHPPPTAPANPSPAVSATVPQPTISLASYSNTFTHPASPSVRRNPRFTPSFPEGFAHTSPPARYARQIRYPPP